MHPITQPRSDTAKPSFCAFEGRPILSDVESPKPKTASPKLSYWQLLLLPLGLILIDTTWGKGLVPDKKPPQKNKGKKPIKKGLNPAFQSGCFLFGGLPALPQ